MQGAIKKAGLDFYARQGPKGWVGLGWVGWGGVRCWRSYYQNKDPFEGHFQNGGLSLQIALQRVIVLGMSPC